MRHTLKKSVQTTVNQFLLNFITEMFKYPSQKDLFYDYAIKSLQINSHQWREIETALIDRFPFIKSYKTKTYSEKQFRDVILANWLLPYPQKVQNDIEIAITELMNSKTAEIKKLKTKNEISIFLSKTLKYIKDKFNFNGAELHQYKQQYHKNRRMIVKQLNEIIQNKNMIIQIQQSQKEEANLETPQTPPCLLKTVFVDESSQITNQTPKYSPLFVNETITCQMREENLSCNYNQEEGLQNLEFYNLGDTPLDSCFTDSYYHLQNIHTNLQASK
ncbi:Hypothetical_protein [Hexamita inflata]|uniref:Hypothetical_protein n=1 Tax=Hexamita inflata TaxID=28002 RepID=A0AA86NI15_9EUKA|nr:Hypothetical protein HINF_LOCUS7929 [Hexamita inflata]